MRNALTYLLIFSFAFILAPKELWHSHDHDHDADHETSHEHSTSFDEDCFVCDFDYAQLSSAVQTPLSIDLKPATSELAELSINCHQEFYVLQNGRAPPVLV